MKLPEYQQQIQAPSKEIAQPIQQAFGVEAAQATAAAWGTLQKASEQVTERLKAMEEQNRQTAVNEELIRFQSEDSAKRRDLLDRRGKDAQGITEEYQKWRNERVEKSLQSIAYPEYRDKYRQVLTESGINAIDQISTSELTQKKAYNTDLTNGLISQTASDIINNPIDSNIKSGFKSIYDMMLSNDAENGIPKAITDSKFRDVSQKAFGALVTSMLEGGYYNEAMARIKSNADILGGEKSIVYSDYMQKAESVKAALTLQTNAENIADKFYGKGPKALENAIDAVQKVGGSPDQIQALTQAVKSQFSIKDETKRNQDNTDTVSWIDRINNARLYVQNRPERIPAAQKKLLSDLAASNVSSDVKSAMKTQIINQLQPPAPKEASEEKLYRDKLNKFTRQLLSGQYNSAEDMLVKNPWLRLEDAVTVSGYRGIPVLTKIKSNDYNMSDNIRKKYDDQIKVMSITDMQNVESWVDSRVNDYVNKENKQPSSGQIDKFYEESFTSVKVITGRGRFGFGTKKTKVMPFQKTKSEWIKDLNAGRVKLSDLPAETQKWLQEPDIVYRNGKYYKVTY
jgi:hypothetical protein